MSWEKVSRDSDEYKACVVTTAGIGAIVGSSTAALSS